jgi:integrase
VCSSPYEALLFAAAFSMAYHGFIRVGEIAFTKLGQEHNILGVNDVKIRTLNNCRVIDVHIAFSKTDQEGKGTLICIQGNNTAACLVLLLQRFLLQRPNVTGVLFCHANGKPITRYQFSAVLRKALISAGIQSDNFKSHSFRMRAASEASVSGISDSKIMEHGRWKSQAVKNYRWL